MKRWQTVFDVLGILALAAALSVTAWRSLSLVRPANDPKHPTLSGMADFQDVVYYPTRAALVGVNPYDARPAEGGGEYFSRFPAGNSFPLYAPLIFLPSLPFALLPLWAAEVLYWIINAALLVLFASVVLRIADLPRSIAAVAIMAVCMLLSRPGQANFYFGNLALPMSLATLGSWWLAERRPWFSGMCLAGSLIKPTFGGPLLVLLLVRGHHRAAGYGLLLAIVGNLVSLGIFLPGELAHPRPLKFLAHNQAVTESDPAVDPLLSASRVDVVMVPERLIGRHLPSVARFGLTLLVLTITGLTLRFMSLASTDNGPRDVLATGLATLSILICIYHNIYDALFSAPAAAAAWKMLRGPAGSANRRLAVPLLCCLAFVALNYFTSRQFLALAGNVAPVLRGLTTQPAAWTLLCVLNGICLTTAWCLLLKMSQTKLESPMDHNPLRFAVLIFLVVAGLGQFGAAQETKIAREGKKKERAAKAKTEQIRWVWPNPQAPAGSQSKIFKSATLGGQEVSYLFWPPPGYDEQDKSRRYPVAYFLHGGGGNYQHIPEAFWPQAADAIKASTLPPFIGIAVNGLPSSFYADSHDGRTPVESIIMKDLLPHVDAAYPTNGVRLIEGFSMGGRGATYLAFKYPDKFRGCADFAGAIHDWSFFGNMQTVAQLFEDEKAFAENWPFTLARKNADALRANLPAGVLIVVGDNDTGRGNTYQWNVKLHGLLDELRIKNELRVVKDVRHSYKLLAEDEAAAKAHLEYYAAVFQPPPAERPSPAAIRGSRNPPL